MTLDDGTPDRSRSASKEADTPMAQGTALGVLGTEGGLIWRHRRAVRRGADAVSPLSWRGTVHVLAWLAGAVGIVVIGRVLLPALEVGWWVGISLAAMLLVAVMWDRRTGRE
jgi:hypothetical protein